MLSSACADGGALGVLARQDVVGGEVADIGGGGHHRRREARAFLVGPVDDADRRFGFDPGVVQRAHHFQRAERAEHAVILAAGRLGVEMRADADGRLRHVASLAQAEHASRAHRHAPPGRRPRRPCGTSRAPACPPRLSVSRRTPPLAVAPNFAVSWMEPQRRAESICRLVAARLMRSVLGLLASQCVRRLFNDAPARARQLRGCSAQSAVQARRPAPPPRRRARRASLR